MHRYIYCFAVFLFAFGIFSLNFVPTAYGQKAKQRSFYIESQPDSPLLIRDLTATILPKNNNRTEPEIKIAFYVENKSKKKIKMFSYYAPAVDGLEAKESEGGII